MFVGELQDVMESVYGNEQWLLTY